VDASEWIGYLASLLVLATFCMQGMVALRAMAIASNVAFIAYAAWTGIGPVLLLHVLLLPTNIYRLTQALRQAGPAETRPRPHLEHSR
jgi:CRP/FNR family cyclic AMP-dependent transcriptional regulator